jgi:hypothetical protein
MSDDNIIFTGDSFPLVVCLFDNEKTPFIIPDDATVTAGLVKNKKTRDLLTPAWSVNNATPGSNWSIGKIIVNVVGADTEALESQSCLVETQVVTGSVKRTFQSREKVLVRKATLP